jgi:hypothetical protein
MRLAQRVKKLRLIRVAMMLNIWNCSMPCSSSHMSSWAKMECRGMRRNAALITEFFPKCIQGYFDNGSVGPVVFICRGFDPVKLVGADLNI